MRTIRPWFKNVITTACAMTTDIEPHVLTRYDVKKRLGKGAYGIVWKAIDTHSGEPVALKKIFDAFRNQTDAQRTFREIFFLQEFADHRNVIKLLNVIRAENDKDIYLVFEFMDTDLHNVIKRGNILQEIHKRYIMYQLFKAMKYLHSAHVIHRDLKPSNVLLDANCFVKICDFGLARSLSQIRRDEETGDPNLTEYVATRWYRAPEILLASHRYTAGVDLWSLGCIIGEMLSGKPLFPGSSTLNQVERIISAIPTPSVDDVEAIKSAYGASVIEKARDKTARKSLDEMVGENQPPDGIDIMKRLLVFNPDKRPNSELCLKHPYVAKFHNPLEESVANRVIVPPLDDDVQLSVEEYRNKLYEMILQKKAERRRKKREELVRSSQMELEKRNLRVTTAAVAGTAPGQIPGQVLGTNGANAAKAAAVVAAGGPEVKAVSSAVLQRSNSASNVIGSGGVVDGRLAEKVSVFNKCLPGRSALLACGTSNQPVISNNNNNQTLANAAANSGRASRLARQRSLENVHVDGHAVYEADAGAMTQTIGAPGSAVRNSFARGLGNPVVTRDSAKPQGSATKHATQPSTNKPTSGHYHSSSSRPVSAKDPSLTQQQQQQQQQRSFGDGLSPPGRQHPDKFGRRVYDNSRNQPSSGAHRATFNSYSQMYGTITEQALAQLHQQQVTTAANTSAGNNGSNNGVQKTK